MYLITRKLEFDAGHRVYGHESKCNHLHGHRYVAEITVSAVDLDVIGRVVDFSAIKERIGQWIDENWDHNILLHKDDPLLRLLDHAYEYTQAHPDTKNCPKPWTDVLAGKQPFIMPNGNPTAENMAAVLFLTSMRLLFHPAQELTVQRVRIYETPNCWADHHSNQPPIYEDTHADQSTTH